MTELEQVAIENARRIAETIPPISPETRAARETILRAALSGDVTAVYAAIDAARRPFRWHGRAARGVMAPGVLGLADLWIAMYQVFRPEEAQEAQQAA